MDRETCVCSQRPNHHGEGVFIGEGPFAFAVSLAFVLVFAIAVALSCNKTVVFGEGVV